MTVEINGLRLPESLLRAMDEGRWPPTVPVAAFNAVFPEEATGPELYSLDTMRGVNRVWARGTHPEFAGTPGEPGSIRPDQSVLIGELGPDQLVALSYSPGPVPSVVYLTGSWPATWVTVAANIDDLLTQLDQAARSTS